MLFPGNRCRMSYRRITHRNMDTSKVVYVSPEFLNGEASNVTYNGKSDKISIGDWERMARALYAYRLGTIEFLDMLAVWEKVLGIEPPQMGK
jgi:hypothetical protein